MHSWITIPRTLAIIFTILLMTACGGGGGSENSTNTNNYSGNAGVSGGGNYGTATLSWIPPTENTDGSPVSLAGYNIYYGTQAGNYTETITIGNNITEYLVDNLPPGYTYYFVITAYDEQGNESEYSMMGSKTIPA